MTTASKKLIFSIGIIILNTILLWVNKIPPPIWSELMFMVVGVYLGAQGIVDAVAKYRGPK